MDGDEGLIFYFIFHLFTQLSLLKRKMVVCFLLNKTKKIDSLKNSELGQLFYVLL